MKVFSIYSTCGKNDSAYIKVLDNIWSNCIFGMMHYFIFREICRVSSVKSLVYVYVMLLIIFQVIKYQFLAIYM